MEKRIPTVKVYMNLGVPKTIERYKNLPFDGIGLMRIEFIIASYIGVHPLKLIKDGREDVYLNKLAEGIGKVAKAVYPKPVIVRFSDLKTNEYRNLKGGGEFEHEESNPMLGWRGASRYISEKYCKIFKMECKAIEKVRESWDNVWVMIPFVRTVWEARKCLRIMKEEGLKREKSLKIWLMAEVPSVALMIDEFNKLPIDGYSIGSNDLCQFVLAVGRDNTTLFKMGYFDERDPAVMKAIEMIVEGAHKGAKTCSICGESVSNYAEVIKRLIELKIDSISVNPDAIMKSREIIRQHFGE